MFNRLKECEGVTSAQNTKSFRPALSNQNVSVATFATFVATDSLLLPQLREMCCKKYNLLDVSTSHVTNADRVGQHCLRPTIALKSSPIL